MKILLTGSEGFIGGNLLRRLQGHEVIRFDIKRSIFEDVTNRDFVLDFVGKTRPEAIIHLAANPDVGRSVAYPHEDLRINTLGTINMLEAARLFPVKAFLLASSAVVYGPLVGDSCSEDYAISPGSPYGIGKFAAEQYCMLYWRKHRVPSVVFRLFNIYGPGQTNAFVMPSLIQRIAKAEGKFPMYGTRQDTRDFVYVDDFCRAMTMALEKVPAGLLANIASGQETPILHVAQTVADLLGKRLTFEYSDQVLEGRETRSKADISRAREILGWETKTSLREGLAKTIESVLGAGHVAKAVGA